MKVGHFNVKTEVTLDNFNMKISTDTSRGLSSPKRCQKTPLFYPTLHLMTTTIDLSDLSIEKEIIFFLSSC